MRILTIIAQLKSLLERTQDLLVLIEKIFFILDSLFIEEGYAVCGQSYLRHLVSVMCVMCYA